MDVTLNVHIDAAKADAVCRSLGHVVEIRQVDADLAHRGLLIVHVERKHAQRVRQSLRDIDGVMDARLGAIAVGL